jgi:SsrA-binding protein
MASKPKSSQPRGAGQSTRKIIVENRKARHEFEILDEWEAGLVLLGTEVKALRDGKISLDEAYGRVDGGEVFLVGAHIEPYTHAGPRNHAPTRKRKLLLHRLEIRKLKAKVTQKGLTLIPLAVFFNERGLAKIVLGLGRGKKLHDKRQDVKRRDAQREMKKF